MDEIPVRDQIVVRADPQVDGTEVGLISESLGIRTPGVVGMCRDAVKDTVAVEVGNDEIFLADFGHGAQRDTDLGEPSLAGDDRGFDFSAAVPFPIVIQRFIGDTQIGQAAVSIDHELVIFLAGPAGIKVDLNGIVSPHHGIIVFEFSPEHFGGERFTAVKEEIEVLTPTANRVTEAIETIIKADVSSAMNKYNGAF